MLKWKWEGYIVENGTMVTTQYPDGGGIPIELTLSLLIFLVIVITIASILDWKKSRKIEV